MRGEMKNRSTISPYLIVPRRPMAPPPTFFRAKTRPQTLMEGPAPPISPCNSAGCRAPFLPHKILYSLEYIFPLEICLLFSPMDLKWGFSGNLGLPGGWPYSWLSNHLFCGHKYLSMLSLWDFSL